MIQIQRKILNMYITNQGKINAILLFIFFYLSLFPSSSQRNVKPHKRTAARLGQ
jgi:hypothetical protein